MELILLRVCLTAVLGQVMQFFLQEMTKWQDIATYIAVKIFRTSTLTLGFENKGDDQDIVELNLIMSI